MSAVRPIPDVAASLAGQSTSDLLVRAMAVVKRWHESDPSGDQSLHLTCSDGRWLAQLTSGLKGSDRYSAHVIGSGYSAENALRAALISLLEDEDDERPVLLAEFEPGEQARC